MIDRLAPTRRPPRPRQGFQRWHRLLFSHFELPEALLRPLVDPRLTLDTFEGRCLVGVVAFEMRQVQPFGWLPRIPTATDFGEINLRTYVHLDGQEPGVCFFSLDAASRLVVTAARLGWGLPYVHASFEHSDDGQQVRWAAARGGEQVYRASFEVGPALSPTHDPASFEFFIAERYQFYASRGGVLHRARVHHTPYQLHTVANVEVTTDLLARAGIPGAFPRVHDGFSPGVDVDIYPMEPV